MNTPDRIRRFQLKGGFLGGEQYVEVRPDGTNGFVVRDEWHDTTDFGKAGYTLDYCLERVRLGHWEELPC